MTGSKDELRQRFDNAREQEELNDTEEDETGNTDEVDNGDNTDDSYDWSDKYNYPLYVPQEFADELDQLYNQYDGKNKIEGGDGLEKHREFLFPMMKAAIEELDMDEVVDWQPDSED